MDFKDCSFRPKSTKVQDIVLEEFGKNGDARCIIFVKTKLLAKALIKWMNETDELSWLKPREFLGQKGNFVCGKTLFYLVSYFILAYCYHVGLIKTKFPVPHLPITRMRNRYQYRKSIRGVSG